MCCYWTFNILICACSGFLLCCCGIFEVQPMTAIIFIAFGKIIRVEKSQGLHFTPPLMIERKEVSLSIQTMQIKGGNVPDSTGSPMNVDCIINFVISDPVASQFNVENLHSYIHNQAYDVVRRVCSKFRYRSMDPAEVSLLGDSHHICNHMKGLMQKRCKVAGVRILKMDFIEISYHAQIAAGLL